MQCNGSGGIGGTMTCTATAPPSQSTGLPTALTQCNGSGPSGPGGAGTVECTATITNNFTNSIPALPGPGGGGPGGGGTGGTGGGSGGTGGGSSGSGGGTNGGGSGGDSGINVAGASSQSTQDLAGRQDLPFTGMDIRVPALAGLLMLVLGFALSTPGRRLIRLSARS
jgi:hypothetical protein